MNHQIGIGHEFGVPAVAFVQDGVDVARLGAGAPELIGVGLVVDQVHHHHAVDFDSVTQRHGRVIEKLCRDPRTADGVDALAQVMVGEHGRQLVQLDWEVDVLHLSGEHVMQ